MKEHFVPIRLGFLEHLLRGDVSAFEFGVYVIVHLQADYSTGIWRGSAPRILNSAPKGAKLREVQRALEHLSDLELLKHFHNHGQRGNYPFLINKYTVRSGALKGMRLNASKSESWQHPFYEPCADDDAQHAPIQQEVESVKNIKRLALVSCPAYLREQPDSKPSNRAGQSSPNEIFKTINRLGAQKAFPVLKRPANNPEVAHLEAGIYREHVRSGYFDCIHHRGNHTEAFHEAVWQAVLDLTSNRAVELRCIRSEGLRDAAWLKLRHHVEMFAGISDYGQRENQVVGTIVRVVAEEALRLKSSTPVRKMSPQNAESMRTAVANR